MNAEHIMQLAAKVEEDCETLADLFDIADLFKVSNSPPEAALDRLPHTLLDEEWSRFGLSRSDGSFVYVMVSPEGHKFVGHSFEQRRAVAAGMLRRRAYEVSRPPVIVNRLEMKGEVHTFEQRFFAAFAAACRSALTLDYKSFVERFLPDPTRFHSGGVIKGSGLKASEVPVILSGEYEVPKSIAERWRERADWIYRRRIGEDLDD